MHSVEYGDSKFIIYEEINLTFIFNNLAWATGVTFVKINETVQFSHKRIETGHCALLLALNNSVRA